MQILSTKLAVPTLRTSLVSRPRLIHALNLGIDCGFVLLSAPAGYGKSTLLRAWVDQTDLACAWLSLDDGDNHPVRFLAYLAAALQKIDPSVGGSLGISLHASPLPDIDILLTPIVNELAQIDRPFCLILDDYHVIQNQLVHQVIAFLLEHRPAPLHLAIATRADPPLPLSRLRARAQVVEIRMEDLRFSAQEVSVFLRQVMDLDLSEADQSGLEVSTEGWVAGLQMAGLSLQGRADASGFIRSFSGENRYIFDFLFDEVFKQQSDETQNFLLQTSILGRFCGALCDRVTLRRDSQAVLESLERSNLFLISLDAQRQWYRYHHLFADLLRSRLGLSSPESISPLHRRASAWYEDERDLENAIVHALAASDFERAASLVERIVQTLDRHNKQVLLTLWLDRLPQEVLETRPWLCVYRAWGYYWTGRREMEEEWLRLAEKSIEKVFAGEDGERRHIQGHIATIRALVALTAEDISGVLEMGQRGLEMLPDGDGMRCEAAIALGGAYWALGDVLRSERAFQTAQSAALRVSNTLAVPSTCYLGIQQVKQGRLQDALATFRHGLRLASLPDGSETFVAGFPNVRLADVLRERNELDLASHHLARGMEQCIRLGQPDVLADAYVCRGLYELAAGNLEAVHEMLYKADQVAQRARIDPFILCWRDGCRLRAWLAEGNLGAAGLWAEKSGLGLDEPFNFLHDLPHINLARVLVAQGISGGSRASYGEAASLLARLQTAAEKAGWVHERIKILVLQAIHCQAFGEEERALQSLAGAAALAEPGGYVRVFIDEGAPIRDLLCALAIELQKGREDENRLGLSIPDRKLERLREYISQLISEFDEVARCAGSAEKDGLHPGPPEPGSEWMVEPLTAREMDVLELLAQGFPDKKIAGELVIARGTVHKHLRNIYGKLDVHSRAQAVIRARELGLL